MTSIVVISGGLSQPSATKLLADRLAQAALRELGLRGERPRWSWVELRELAHDITNHLLTGFPAPPLAAAITAVRDADAVIAVTPVFSASYSGPVQGVHRHPRHRFAGRHAGADRGHRVGRRGTRWRSSTRCGR